MPHIVKYPKIDTGPAFKQRDAVDEIAFSTLEVCKILMLERERLREWINKGFVRPAIYNNKKWASFTTHYLYLIALFKMLVEYGFNRKVAANILEEEYTEGIEVYGPGIWRFFVVKKDGNKYYTSVIDPDEDDWDPRRWDSHYGRFRTDKEYDMVLIFSLRAIDSRMSPFISEADYFVNMNFGTIRTVNFKP